MTKFNDTERAEMLNVEPMLQMFEYRHLPPSLAAISEQWHDLAYTTVATTPRNPERTVALRKLLEGKDAAVRAFIYKTPAEVVAGWAK